MNKPLSACCGAEMRKKVVNIWRGKGCFVEERRECSECGDTIPSQPPASKGEGWRETVNGLNIPSDTKLYLLDVLIPAAIDEAVEETKQRMSCLSGICDKCHRRIQCERVLNPHSPQ